MSKKVSTNKFNEGLCHNIFSGIIVFFYIEDHELNASFRKHNIHLSKCSNDIIAFIKLFMITKNIKGLMIAHDMGNSI